KPTDIIVTQLLIRPTGDEWKTEGEKEVAKIIGREEPKKEGGFLGGLFSNLLIDVVREVTEPGSMIGPPEKPERKKTGKESLMQHLSPGEREIVTAIDR